MAAHSTRPTNQQLASAFSRDEVRSIKLEWIWRVWDLAQATGAPVELARQAVEQADQDAQRARLAEMFEPHEVMQPTPAQLAWVGRCEASKS